MTSESLYKELFEGELSDVEEDCPGCQELEYTDSSNLFRDIFNGKIILHDISDLSKDLDEKLLDTFVKLLIFHRMHQTLAELIIIRNLQVDESILHNNVKSMIKNKKDVNENKNIHDIFNEEVEQLFGKSYQLNQPKETKNFCIDKINYKKWMILSCIIA
ncbi:12384_t:CDS:1, partial [Funneliformis caledonium]